LKGGASVSSIARTLNRTVSCISNAMRRLGVPKTDCVAYLVNLPQRKADALEAAARRRNLKPVLLAERLLCGMLALCSVDEVLRWYAEYDLDRRADGILAFEKRKRVKPRQNAGQPA